MSSPFNSLVSSSSFYSSLSSLFSFTPTLPPIPTPFLHYQRFLFLCHLHHHHYLSLLHYCPFLNVTQPLRSWYSSISYPLHFSIPIIFPSQRTRSQRIYEYERQGNLIMTEGKQKETRNKCGWGMMITSVHDELKRKRDYKQYLRRQKRCKTKATLNKRR